MKQTLSEMMMAREDQTLSPFAMKSKNSKGRDRQEEECPLRTVFQRDRDRIIHCKTFRRLTHKTQVFLSPTGDHYRNRLTHALEVSQIARTIALALGLNETLAEAIALGHDLGHTPFGHAGENALNKLHPGGFKHSEQSIRVVEFLENKGRGLNLTAEVKDGILKHSKGLNSILPSDKTLLPATLEGQVVRLSDIIAYVNHDLDDAIRAGIITAASIPSLVNRRLGQTTSARLRAMTIDLTQATLKQGGAVLTMSDELLETIEILRNFLYKNVYAISRVNSDFAKAKKILKELYCYFVENNVPIGDPIKNQDWQNEIGYGEGIPRERIVCDFIAGMTDRYALDLYTNIFFPKPWNIL